MTSDGARLFVADPGAERDIVVQAWWADAGFAQHT
ncbi:hypothetical protein SAXI111661_03990 [Saccharomonospora xinjiangensis]|nr:hypothetical protein EYD13_06525 [Saccharomonospora xinjiangensis]